jgi:hypothetical protein
MGSRALVTQKLGKQTASGQSKARGFRSQELLEDSKADTVQESLVLAVRPTALDSRDVPAFSRGEIATDAAPAVQLFGQANFGGAEPQTRSSQPRGAEPLPWPIRAKLKIGAVDEPQEREADEIADRVLRMPNQLPVDAESESGLLHRKCEACSAEERQKREEEASGKISRRALAGKSFDGTAAPPIVLDVLRSPGRPLDPATRTFFEPRFGRDFGKVRIHTGPRAEESAEAIRARAYTAGNDIVFGPGQHRPNDPEGRWLLAHELAHVVQPALRLGWISRAPLMYDPTAFTIPLPPQPFTLDDAKKLVEQKKTATPPVLKSGAVKGAAAGSTEEIFLWYILAEVARPDQKGKEVDVVTAIGWPPSTGGAAPVGKVTVQIDSDGNGVAELVSAGAVSAPTTYTKPEDAIAELKSKYGVKSVKDGDSSWSLPELNKMVGAFALLPAADRAALKDVDLLRVATISSGKDCGEFGSSESVSGTTVTAEATLKIADCTFGHEAESFVGGKAAQSPASYRTIVHEVGHAVAKKSSREAGVAKMEAIAKSNEAIEASNEAIQKTNALIDEFNDLVKEHNDLIDKVNKASGKDKDAAQSELNAKKKELAAKKTQVDAAKKDQATKKTAVDTAKQKVEAKKQAEAAAAAPLGSFQTAATAKKADAAAKLGAAKTAAAQFSQQDTDEGADYRKAVDDAATAIADYATSAAKEDADLDNLDATVQTAIDARNSARTTLNTANSSNAALGKFGAVDKAQDAWLDAEKALAHARQRSEREQRFVDFVNAHNIKPFTQYAKDNWPLKPGEFYAEAYSLWRTDPEYLKANAKPLFDWFEAGRYR